METNPKPESKLNRRRDSTSTVKNPSTHSRSSSEFKFDSNSSNLNTTQAKVIDFIRSELSMTGEDLELLETFNNLTKEQFETMSSVAQTLLAGGSKMQQAFSDFEPMLNQIDEISLQVDYLELVSSELVEYSLELEEKVKMLRKRKDKDNVKAKANLK